MKITIFIIISFVFILSGLQGYSQKGFLRGKIIDEKTGEELIGATVVVTGTTKGTITDFDGNYSIELDEGTYNFTCSYISYQTQNYQAIKIKADDVTIINIQLDEAQVALDEVYVVARASRRTEAALQVLQRRSSVVLDGISAQQISRLGDSDAAGALKRVTGVSVEGGKYIYVRGLSDRYSKTTLNGAEIPGLDPNRNTVQLDLFPSNIIENMVIHKTFSPNLPGSFTGGHIDIITKDFPQRYTLQFSASFEFNPISHFNPDYLTYEGGKYDWLGIDDGTRSIPSEAKGQIPARFYDDDQLDLITKSFNKTMEPGKKSSFMNQSYSFSVGNQIEIKEKPLGYVIGLSYSNKYNFIDNGVTGRFKLIDGADELLTSQLTLDTDKKGSNDVMWAALANVNYKINNSHKVGLLLLHNHSGESSARYQQGEKSSDEAGMLYQTRTLQFLERGFSSIQLKGEDYLENVGKIKIDWLSSYTYSKQYEPDLRFFTNHYTLQDNSRAYEISQSLYPVPTRYYRLMNELNWDNKINSEKPYHIGSIDAKLKAGVSFVLKKREFREKKFNFNENSNSYNGDITGYLDDSNINASEGRLFISNSETSDKKNSYNGYQRILGSYIMTELELTKKFKFVTGIRMERAYISTSSLKENEKEGILDNTDFLPSLNTIYSLQDNMNLRFSCNRTLARPGFRELAPYASLNFVGDFVFIGNANLKRTLIDNFDFRYEFFFKPGELFSFSAFYKRFINPIERTFNTEAANPELTLRNADEARIYGVEMEIRKSLEFVSWIKNLNLGGNLTYVKSSVTVDSKELSLKREFDPEFPDERVMFGQAPYIVNVYLNYTNDSLRLSSNISYNISGERLYLVNAVGIPDVFEQPRGQLDFNISKILGEKFNVKFSVKNLLDTKYNQTYFYKNTPYIFENYKSGRFYSISLSYLID